MRVLKTLLLLLLLRCMVYSFHRVDDWDTVMRSGELSLEIYWYERQLVSWVANVMTEFYPLPPERQQIARTQILYIVCLKISDYNLLFYTCCHVLMKFVESHHIWSLLFMMTIMVQCFVSVWSEWDIHKVMTSLILVILVLVLLELRHWLPSKFCCRVFSAISYVCINYRYTSKGI
jgi:hypothetical protein